MKKLNNKGFTLVELLAVIVILAIVVGITMVTILPTLSNAKTKAFNTAVDTIQVYLQEDYSNCLVGDTNLTGDLNVLTAGSCTTLSDTTSLLNKTGYAGDMTVTATFNSTTERWEVTGKVALDAESKATGQFKDLGTTYSYTAK